MTRTTPTWTYIACFGLMAFLLPSMLVSQQRTEEFERPVDHYAYAQGLMKGKLYDFALKAFEGFVSSYPEHELVPSASANIIACHRKLEQSEEMLAAIKAYKEKWPKSENVDVFSYWAGESFLSRGVTDKAKECFESLLESKNESLKEYSTFLLARAIMQENPRNERIYQLYGVIAGMPFRADRPFREQAAFELAKHRQLQLKYGEALALFEKLGNYADGRPTLREEALYSVGEIYFAQHDYARACKAYGGFLTLFPKGKWSNEVRKRHAEATFQQRDVSGALKLVLEWRNMNPQAEDYEMDCLHARCLYQLSEYGTAWPHFEVVFKNGKAPLEMRRYCLFFGIHCLLEDDKTASWEKGLELCKLYFDSYSDASFENKVMEFKGRLFENLGRPEEALSAYDETIKQLGASDASRTRQLLLRKAQCLQSLKRWKAAAELLRALALDGKDKATRLKYICAAADLAMMADRTGKQGEENLKTALSFEEITPEVAEKCHEQLAAIYLQRGDYPRTHSEIELLLKTLKGKGQIHHLYRDAWVLAEMKKYPQAIASLKKALGLATPSDEQLEVNIRLLLLTLYQVQLKDGNQEAAFEMLEQYVHLEDKPKSLTQATFTSSVLYQLATIQAQKLAKTGNTLDRRFLERLYERAIDCGGTDAPAMFAAFRLAKLYMEPADGRFALAEKALERVTTALIVMVNDRKSHEHVLEQLGNADNFLREMLSLQCVCCYRQKKYTDAMAIAERVLMHGLNYSAARRCLLVQAKVYFGSSPVNLDMALKKLSKYKYIISPDQPDDEEEEEAAVLLLRVHFELLKTPGGQKRLESALEAYSELKVRYPERLKREGWIREFERAFVKDGQP